MDVHCAPVPDQWRHVIGFVEQAQQTTGVYEEDSSPFPSCRIISHVSHHVVCSLAAARVDPDRWFSTKLGTLYKTIESEDIRHDVNIPSQSFLLVQNDQYVPINRIENNASCFSNFFYKFKLFFRIYSIA